MHARVRDWVCRCQAEPRVTRGSVGVLLVRELVHALIRQPEEASRVARAHLQFSGSQYADGASRRAGCSTILFVGLCAKTRVRPRQQRLSLPTPSVRQSAPTHYARQQHAAVSYCLFASVPKVVGSHRESRHFPVEFDEGDG